MKKPRDPLSLLLSGALAIFFLCVLAEFLAPSTHLSAALSSRPSSVQMVSVHGEWVAIYDEKDRRLTIDHLPADALVCFGSKEDRCRLVGDWTR